MVSRTRRTLDFSFIVVCIELLTEYLSCQFVYFFIGHSSSTLAVAYVVYIITMKNVFKILWFLLRVFASCACVGRLEIRPDKVVIFNGFFGVSGVWMSALYFFFLFDIVSGVCELRSECGICFVSCVFESSVRALVVFYCHFNNE